MVGQETTGSQLTTFSTALTAGGPHDLMVGIANHDASSQAYDAQYQAWHAADQLAKVYQAKAESALDEAAQAKADAHQAREDAKTAVQLQQNAVVAIDAQRQSLIQELAQAQNISVALATQRQQGLEQRRQEKIAEQRRIEQLQQLREQRRQESREQARIRQLRRIQHLRELRQQHHDQHNTPTTPAPPPPPPPPPAAPAGRPDAAAAERDGRPDRDQLRLRPARRPVRLGCRRSGLVGLLRPDDGCLGRRRRLAAALLGGAVRRDHADLGRSAAARRPGLLGRQLRNDPSSIFHVGLYIGDGNMIHAPRTGVPVKIENIWYWETPDFFGRPHR